MDHELHCSASHGRKNWSIGTSTCLRLKKVWMDCVKGDMCKKGENSEMTADREEWKKRTYCTDLTYWDKDIQPHRCHQCSPTNGTTCEQAQGWLTATCPGARPYCATVAVAPDFETSLGCAAATEAACSLTFSPRQTLELTCICSEQLCNAPFSHKLRNELLNISFPNTNDSALTEAFFKLSNFANVSQSALYKTITVDATATIKPARNYSEVTTLSSVTASGLKRRAEVMPRAEALKQQVTVPSDDDEDESEGSGTYEDSRSHIQSHSASAPAAPSSFLPAEENKAVHIFPNLLLSPLLFFYTLV